LAAGVTQPPSVEARALPSRRNGEAIRPPTGPPPPRRGELADLNEPGVTPPVLLSRTGRPAYPTLALARGLSGTVVLSALVDEKGRVVEVALVRSSAPGLGFEDAAMTYVHSRVYRPATKRGVRVRVRLPLTVEFQLPAR
jgi:TonB family protein